MARTGRRRSLTRLNSTDKASQTTRRPPPKRLQFKGLKLIFAQNHSPNHQPGQRSFCKRFLSSLSSRSMAHRHRGRRRGTRWRRNPAASAQPGSKTRTGRRPPPSAGCGRCETAHDTAALSSTRSDGVKPARRRPTTFNPQIPLPPRATVKGGRSWLIAEPPCMIATCQPTKTWCTRQLPERNARS